MVRMTPEEYVESVKKPKRKLYLNGRAVEDLSENPVTRTVIGSMAKVYEMEMEPEYKGVLTAKSHLTGIEVSRNVGVNRSVNDLFNRIEMALLLAQTLGTCNYACPGCDLITALASVTYQVDKERGTDYHARFTKFLRDVQNQDLRCSGDMTDPRGDRSKRPTQLDDPDLYVRVVERKSNGIVVRGAKLHQSGAYANHWHLVVPNVTLRKGEEQYALIVAVPAGEEGVKYVNQFNMYTAERLIAERDNDVANPSYGIRETCVLIFDDVFVPWDRVFLCGEVEYTRALISRFGAIHRMTCGGACKVGFADLVLGATQLMAEWLGVANASHIVEQITKALIIRETTYACALAAAYKGREVPPGSGVYIPNEVYGNISKLQIGEGFYELLKIAGDVAGGLIATAPSLRDLRSPEVKHYLEKYLKVKVDAERRVKLAKFLQMWMLHGPMTWHGAGPIQAQKIALRRAVDLEPKKVMAAKLAGIEA